jgi:hypothetical protein
MAVTTLAAHRYSLSEAPNRLSPTPVFPSSPPDSANRKLASGPGDPVNQVEQITSGPDEPIQPRDDQDVPGLKRLRSDFAPLIFSA